MNLSKFFWRALPIVAIIWATRTGAIEWHEHYRKMKGVMKGVVTQMEMGSIARGLVTEYRGGGDLPRGRNFSRWLQQTMDSKVKPAEEDHFGNPYRLRTFSGGFSVESAGYDGRFGTEDDIVQRVKNLRRR